VTVRGQSLEPRGRECTHAFQNFSNSNIRPGLHSHALLAYCQSPAISPLPDY
jgi:hypothetical protein